MVTSIEHSREVLKGYKNKVNVELKDDLPGKVEDDVRWGYQALCKYIDWS